MSAVESIGVALFLIVVVFFILFCVFLFIKLFSFLIRKIENYFKQKNHPSIKN